MQEIIKGRKKMYCVQFKTKVGPPEEYFYHNENDAKNHLSLFEDDDSGLYDEIVLVQEKDGGYEVLQRIIY